MCEDKMPFLDTANDDPVFICLTPVRNEAWILPSFLKMAEIWADWIIIIDQCSTDGSREIASSHEKVILLKNDEPEFDERYRQKTLLEEARRLPGKRILFALDADESLSANFIFSGDKEAVAQAPSGTIIELRWPQILPTQSRYYSVPHTPFGYVDDGVQHYPERIHSARLPQPEGSNHLKLQNTVNLHLQYLPWERQKIKQMWYQCWETLNSTDKDFVHLFRQYNRMRGFSKSNTLPIQKDWIAGYQDRGIDFGVLEQTSEGSTWWENDIVSMISHNGAARFKKTCIWEVNWCEKAVSFGSDEPQKFSDPRSSFDRLIHHWLIATQRYASNYLVRVVDKILIKNIW